MILKWDKYSETLKSGCPKSGKLRNGVIYYFGFLMLIFVRKPNIFIQISDTKKLGILAITKNDIYKMVQLFLPSLVESSVQKPNVKNPNKKLLYILPAICSSYFTQEQIAYKCDKA